MSAENTVESQGADVRKAVGGLVGEIARGFLAGKGIIPASGGGSQSSASVASAVSVNPAITVISGGGYASPSTGGGASASAQAGGYGTGRPDPLYSVDTPAYTSGQTGGATPAATSDQWLLILGVGAVVFFLFMGKGK